MEHHLTHHTEQADVLAEDDWAAAVDRYLTRRARRSKGPRRWIIWRTACRR